jgi:hypothetical protein
MGQPQNHFGEEDNDKEKYIGNEKVDYAPDDIS